MRRNILGASNTLLIEWTNEDRDTYLYIRIIEGCNGLSIARQWAKPTGLKLKKWGFRGLAGPKNGQKPPE
jgi:hypothetical protein